MWSWYSSSSSRLVDTKVVTNIFTIKNIRRHINIITIFCIWLIHKYICSLLHTLVTKLLFHYEHVLMFLLLWVVNNVPFHQNEKFMLLYDLHPFNCWCLQWWILSFNLVSSHDIFTIIIIFLGISLHQGVNDIEPQIIYIDLYPTHVNMVRGNAIFSILVAKSKLFNYVVPLPFPLIVVGSLPLLSI